MTRARRESRPSRRPESQLSLAQRILDYFLRHPEAADTLEGVSAWVVIDGSIREQPAVVDCALSELVAKGFLEERSAPGPGRIFSLSKSKRGEAARFVQESGSTDRVH